MAVYKYREHLTPSGDAVFDTRHAPGTRPRNAGIYRCLCGEETAVAPGNALPPPDHHRHQREEGKVEWQLLVFPEQRK